jgi:hypothetical protein
VAELGAGSNIAGLVAAHWVHLQTVMHSCFFLVCFPLHHDCLMCLRVCACLLRDGVGLGSSIDCRCWTRLRSASLCVHVSLSLLPSCVLCELRVRTDGGPFVLAMTHACTAYVDVLLAWSPRVVACLPANVFILCVFVFVRSHRDDDGTGSRPQVGLSESSPMPLLLWRMRTVQSTWRMRWYDTEHTRPLSPGLGDEIALAKIVGNQNDRQHCATVGIVAGKRTALPRQGPQESKRVGRLDTLETREQGKQPCGLCTRWQVGDMRLHRQRSHPRTWCLLRAGTS